MSEFVEVKTADLVGAALDWAVAQAAGWVAARFVPVHSPSKTYYEVRSPAGSLLSPSTDWSQGGPLIDGYAIGFSGWSEDNWLAFSSPEDISHEGIGSTHLIAACRAIVASVLGETVSVPKELLS